MSLAPGTRISSYDVVSLLGAGGMGEVYRARDTKLDRDVALKILPESFASDPDRLMRFEREAKTLAALNHPHIAQIHGVEDAGARRALVMELVEGEDSHSGWRAARCRLTKHSRLRGRSLRRSKPRMKRASSIAISSRRTSRCGPTAPSRSSTSGSRSRA
jgi:serine/threonine protein kinase